MAQTTVAADVLQALDRLRHLSAELTLDRRGLLDRHGDAADLVLGQLAGPHRRIDLGFGQDLLGAECADAVDVLQRDINALLTRNVYTRDTRHFESSIPAAACGADWSCRLPSQHRGASRFCSSRKCASHSIAPSLPTAYPTLRSALPGSRPSVRISIPSFVTAIVCSK